MTGGADEEEGHARVLALTLPLEEDGSARAGGRIVRGRTSATIAEVGLPHGDRCSMDSLLAVAVSGVNEVLSSEVSIGVAGPNSVHDEVRQGVTYQCTHSIFDLGCPK